MPNNKPLTQLTIFLMKENLPFEKYLKPGKEVTEYDIRDEIGLEAKIYIGEESSNKPAWLGFLQEGSSGPIADFYNASQRGLLLARLQDHVFALTFGYGRHLLADDVEEVNFGLKTTLNGVNADRLRSLDMVSVMNLGLQTRMQSARQGNTAQFGSEISNDLLKMVSGKPIDNLLGTNIAGQDSLSISPKMDFNDLPKILATVLTVYQNENYKQHFAWIDNIKAVKSRTLVNTLDEELVAAISDEDRWEEIGMAPPEAIDWSTYSCCGFSAKGEKGVELTLESFMNSVPDDKDVDIELLKRRRVYLEKVGSDEYEKLWKVYGCLTFETEVADRKYILCAGVWYEVNADFATTVADYVRSLPASSLEVLVIPGHEEHEGPFNERLAASNDDYSLADKKNVRCEFAKSSIEPCDILTADGKMVHVKPGRRSSTLSHLFSQGRVAAEAFKRDKVFRKGVRRNLQAEKKIDCNIIPLDNLKPSKYEITYLFIDDRPGEVVEMLPFFSQINLMHSAEKIKLMGYKVSVMKLVRAKADDNEEEAT